MHFHFSIVSKGARLLMCCYGQVQDTRQADCQALAEVLLSASAKSGNPTNYGVAIHATHVYTWPCYPR
jgi:hypothetical protein